MNDAVIEVIEEVSLVTADDAEIVVVREKEIAILSEGLPGPRGVPGPSGNSLPAIYLAYGDATPDAIYTPTADVVIKRVTLVVTAVFNGVGARLSIGTQAAPEILMAEAESGLAEAAAFETTPNIEVAAGTAIKKFITPGSGASQGTAMVMIEYAEA